MQRIWWRNSSCQGDRDGRERNSFSCITCSPAFLVLFAVAVCRVNQDISRALWSLSSCPLLFSCALAFVLWQLQIGAPVQIWILKRRIFCFNEKSTCTRVFQTRSFINSASPRAIHQRLHADYRPFSLFC